LYSQSINGNVVFKFVDERLFFWV